MVATPPLLYRLTLDDRIFLLINRLTHTPLTDTIALTLSGVGDAGIIWVLLMLWLFIREERRYHWFFLPFILAGASSGAIANLILKPLVARPRPPVDVIGGILVSASPHDYSFPSGHATVAFAMAVVLSQKEPRWKWFFYVLAVLISLSRIYLGVHYPLDIAVGALLGLGIGYASIVISFNVLKQ